MSQIQYLDELVREYLLFRGFTNSLKAFDQELKQDKDKAFRTDKVLDQILHCISSYDLHSLRELWNHLDQRMFSKLDTDLAHGVKKLENSVLKLYLINACVNNKSDKVNEFFAKMAPELHGQSDWKEWFALAYLKNPEESPYFSVYFSKHWQDTLVVSLHNFLSIIAQSMGMPVLGCYEEEVRRAQRLAEENERLRGRLAQASAPHPVLPPPDIMDDFYIIAQEAGCSGESQGKSIKNLMRNIGGHVSPGSSRKQPHQEEGRAPTRGVQRGAQQPPGTNSRHPGGESVPKRSLSLDSRRRGREDSVERVRASNNKKDNFLLLSQEKFSEHKAGVSQCKFSSTGTYIASGDVDGAVKVWTYAPQPKVVWSEEGGKAGSVTSLAWLGRSERQVVRGSAHGVVTLVDTARPCPLWQLGFDPQSPLHQAKVLSLCTSQSESHIVCTTVGSRPDQRPSVLLIDTKTANIQEVVRLEGDGAVAECCALQESGWQVLLGCRDGWLRCLDLRSCQVLDVSHPHSGPVCSLLLTPDYSTCFSFAQDHKVCRQRVGGQSSGGAEESQLPWSGAVTPWGGSCGGGGGGAHGTQALALHQSACHALVACGPAPPNIYQVGSGGLVPVLSLGEEGGKSRVVTCDWASANQCSTCLSGYSDGNVRISTILTP